MLRVRSAAARPVRVLLVEDNDVYAHTLELLLEPIETVEILNRARNGADGVQLAVDLEPDVVLMDVSMPIMGGFEATRRIRAHRPETRVVMLTSSDDPADKARARAAGACDYLTKDTPLDDLIAMLTDVTRQDAADVPYRATTALAWA